MSFKIGGSASKSTSSSTSNTNSNTVTNGNSNTNTNGSFHNVTTPTVPAWAADLTQGVAGRVGDLAQIDPQSLVAGGHPPPGEGGGQRRGAQAATTAGSLSGSPWNFDAAADQTRSVMGANAPHTGAVQASPYLQQYMD